MSKKTSQKSNNFVYEPTTKLPKLGKIKTEWDLKAHYYSSEKDPQIESDINAYERSVARFAKKFSQSNFTTSRTKLLDGLNEYETLHKKSKVSKL